MKIDRILWKKAKQATSLLKIKNITRIILYPDSRIALQCLSSCSIFFLSISKRIARSMIYMRKKPKANQWIHTQRNSLPIAITFNINVYASSYSKMFKLCNGHRENISLCSSYSHSLPFFFLPCFILYGNMCINYDQSKCFSTGLLLTFSARCSTFFVTALQKIQHPQPLPTKCQQYSPHTSRCYLIEVT